MRKIICVAIVMILALAVAGCEEERQAPITGGGANIQLNKDNEIRFLKSVLNENPNNLQALIQLGNVFMDTSRYQEAIDAYGRALIIDPKNVNVRVDRGICYRRIGRPDMALEHFRKGIEYDPTHAMAHMNSGVVLAYDFRDPKGAIPAFEKYLELYPAAQNAAQIRNLIEELKVAAAQQPGQQQTSP